jgi:hypothetical protein
MTTSRRRSEASVSRSAVAIWTSTKTTASSDVFRWTASSTNRGIRRVRTRRTLATPRPTLSVRRISATIPVPRIRYQYAAAPVVVPRLSNAGRSQEPPDTAGDDVD